MREDLLYLLGLLAAWHYQGGGAEEKHGRKPQRSYVHGGTPRQGNNGALPEKPPHYTGNCLSSRRKLGFSPRCGPALHEERLLVADGFYRVKMRRAMGGKPAGKDADRGED